MARQDELQEPSYPTGRGYGHDYMRGGEVLGGYGYSQRPEYETPRGELSRTDHPLRRRIQGHMQGHHIGRRQKFMQPHRRHAMRGIERRVIADVVREHATVERR